VELVDWYEINGGGGGSDEAIKETDAIG